MKSASTDFMKGEQVRIKQSLKAAFLVLCFFSLCAAAPGGRPTDKTITTWVEETLRQDPRIDSSRIKVVTQAGIVHLTGQVPDLASKKYAGLEAGKIYGVTGVVNEIIPYVPYQSDTDLEQNLKRGFLSSADIPLHSVKIQVKDGQVFLSGRVDSFAEKKEAGLIATELKGVRSVDNRLVVANRLTRSDQEIRQDVIDALGRDVYLLNLLLDAQVHHGVVTLTGNVYTPYQKERATEDCLSVANVEAVKNDLTIAVSEAAEAQQKALMPTDSELEKSVHQALYQDLRVMDPFGINVKAVSGQVTLSGALPSYYQKRLAGRDAHEVVGVVEVVNRIRVDTAWREDERIRDDINFALDTDAALSGLDIQVRVKNGTVTLDGKVNTPYEREQASEVASRIMGVRDVINDISTHKYPKYSDAALERHIKTRLAADWETHRVADLIRVTVKKGMVTLSGDVDTWSQYREAAKVASLTDGVWELVNRLRVTGVNYPWDKN